MNPTPNTPTVESRKDPWETATTATCNYSFFSSSANRLAGPLFSAHPELRVQTTPTNFRVPDVCGHWRVISTAPREQIVQTPPLLCIEVLSPEDTMGRTMVRVREFLSMGVREVWVLDPDTRGVQVCIGDTITLKQEGTLAVPETPVMLTISDIFSILGQA